MGLQRREAQGDAIIRGQRGANLDQAGEGCEPIARHGHAICPKRQAFRDKNARRVGLKALSKLIRLADQLYTALQPQTRGVGNREAQFARIALAKLGHRQQKYEYAAGHASLILRARSQRSAYNRTWEQRWIWKRRGTTAHDHLRLTRAPDR